MALAALGGRGGAHFPALALQPPPGWAPPPPPAPPPEWGRGGRAPRTEEEEAARLEFLLNQPQRAAAAASAQATASAAPAPVPPPRTLAIGATAPAHPQAQASASLARASTTATLAPLEAPEAGTDEAKFRHLLNMHQQGAARLRQLHDEHVKGAAIISRILGQAPAGASGTLAISDEDDLLLQEHIERLNHLKSDAGEAIEEQEEGLREMGFSLAPFPAPVPPAQAHPPAPASAQPPRQPLPPQAQQQSEQWREGGGVTQMPTAPMPPDLLAFLQQMLTYASQHGTNAPSLQQPQHLQQPQYQQHRDERPAAPVSQRHQPPPMVSAEGKSGGFATPERVLTLVRGERGGEKSPGVRR